MKAVRSVSARVSMSLISAYGDTRDAATCVTCLWISMNDGPLPNGSGEDRGVRVLRA